MDKQAQYQKPCNCARMSKAPGTSHANWCAFLRPPKPVSVQRASTSEILREITGVEKMTVSVMGPSDEDPEMLYGIPEAMGTSEEFPLTSRTGDYLGQPRDGWVNEDWILLSPEEQQLIDDVKKGVTGGELRRAIDRFMARIYDRVIDELTARQREHTKRLGQ